MTKQIVQELPLPGQGFEHTHRGQCADWCTFCVAYLARHPKAQAHRMWPEWTVFNPSRVWICRMANLIDALDFAQDYSGHYVRATLGPGSRAFQS